ncbi:response regulator [Chitinimonas sp. BJB300]|uniref:response regulator n=1 Tax=Chitinimonas sp. BJB300 TaxID=1559339 RepID=UPI000C0D090A|nr:response regulator [Chitinimonas sp. BJB300]PHV10948.1 response regulator receiver protein [Chitinimonas sp. BJB300]TSJ89884.1 response regulator [Chitinimonas sp. BJB300]
MDDSKPKILLLVDDEPFNLEILAEHLIEAGYAIETAADGEAAWACLMANPLRYDAVLLDRMMPGLNGMEVLRRMQANAQLSTLPVVMQTAVGSAEAVREGMEGGAYYYLTKPFERDILLAIVAAAVAQHRTQDSIRRAAENPLEAMMLMHNAEFSLSTLDEAQRLAGLLCRMAKLPERVAMGLTELMVNAIEHGNLGLGYADKKAMMQNGRWREELEAMQRLPEFAGKRVEVSVQRKGDLLRVEVRDEGNGFDWEQYMQFDPSRAFDPNGRGISMARAMSFETLDYQDKGNRVVATIRLA